MVGSEEAVLILLRWSHIVAGVFWIGLLYYFNVVQVPVFKTFDAATRSNAIQKLVPVALAWFRYAALMTVILGLLLIYREEHLTSAYLKTTPGVTISAGMALGLIMAFNVWFLIWPNQKRIIEANIAKANTGRDIPPESAGWAKTAFYASRTNFLLSFPMLFFMTATSHLAASTTVTQNEILGIGVGIFLVGCLALWWFTSMKPAAKTTGTPTTPPKT